MKKGEVKMLIVKSLQQREQRKEERERERKTIASQLAPTDDLHLFFMSMYEFTKTMPRSSQHNVRNNVFQQ